MKNSFVVKCIAVVLFAVMLTTALLSTLCLIFGFESGAFTSEADRYDYKQVLLKGLTWRPLSDVEDSLAYYHNSGYAGSIENLFNDMVSDMSENLMFELKDADGKVVASNIDASAGEIINTTEIIVSVLKEEYQDEVFKSNTNYESDNATEYETVFVDNIVFYEQKTYTVTVCLKEVLVVKDSFYYVGELFDLVADKHTKLLFIASLTLILSFVFAIFLICSAGHTKKSNDIYLSKFDKIPLDLLIIVLGIITFLLGVAVVWITETIFFEMISYNYDKTLWVAMPYLSVIGIFGAIMDGALFALLLMTSAVRIKTGTFIKSTIIYKIIVLFIKVLKKILKGFIKICKRIWSLIRKIPMVWKTVIVAIVIIFIEFLLLVADVYLYAPFVLIFNCILCISAIFVAILLKDIKNSTEDIANGNVYKKIDTKHLFLDLKDHAENINNMSDGIQKAVAEQMKSERLKTELITNVSHDIKTPLTSIINYVDLLEKEEIQNETAKEYIDVLSRQSIRLKKLIDDLLEASKVSTGNISVNLMEFELGILLSQALGEYEERFEKNNLQVVLNKTDEALFVMADNRHMWRVFDNILNNIAKYAQSGTRVYIDAKRKDKNVEISFRNISKDPLNISGDELMERFVRGDSSRNTEGSGLGLSIAKSLTEVQKGKLDIQIDGDLFKVSLIFPLNE